MFDLINLAIAAVIMVFALTIKHFLSDAMEEESSFVRLIAVFLVSYIVAALAMSFFNPMDRIKPILAAPKNQEIQETTVRI
ncbi:hypothetical protein HZC53_03035 [Candidatus Uhrbacteria bacterium]|nr:hypothetical protein [Candidatus Uhrbacteria bacterium]